MLHMPHFLHRPSALSLSLTHTLSPIIFLTLSPHSLISNIPRSGCQQEAPCLRCVWVILIDHGQRQVSVIVIALLSDIRHVLLLSYHVMVCHVNLCHQQTHTVRLLCLWLRFLMMIDTNSDAYSFYCQQRSPTVLSLLHLLRDADYTHASAVHSLLPSFPPSFLSFPPPSLSPSLL
jgi:hypothetical protein